MRAWNLVLLEYGVNAFFSRTLLFRWTDHGVFSGFPTDPWVKRAWDQTLELHPAVPWSGLLTIVVRDPYWRVHDHPYKHANCLSMEHIVVTETIFPKLRLNSRNLKTESKRKEIPKLEPYRNHALSLFPWDQRESLPFFSPGAPITRHHPHLQSSTLCPPSDFQSRPAGPRGT